MKHRNHKVGQIYEVRHKWLMSRQEIKNYNWKSVDFVMYLGESRAKSDKGSTVYELLVDGKIMLVRNDFLRFLEPISEDR